MAAQRDLTHLQDTALADNARRGDRAAFDELFRRHAPAAWRLAVAVTRDATAAERAVADGFASSLARTADAPASRTDEDLRVALLRATRRAASDAGGAPSARASSGSLAVQSVSPRVAVIRESFDSLPERWRSVLWLVDVDGTPALDAAGAIEVAPEALDALLARARFGLQEQVLQTGLKSSSPAACRRTSDLLTRYAAGSLTTSDAAKVRSHLDGCKACRNRLAALDDLVPVLRGTSLVLPLLLADAAAARWSSSLVRNVGPLGLGLPNGQPMPVWAQRAFAGVIASFVALGIAGATLVASRGSGGGRDVVARPASGEIALGDQPRMDIGKDALASITPDREASSASPVRPDARIDEALALPRTAEPAHDGSVIVPVSSAPADAPPEDDAAPAQAIIIDVPGIAGVTLGDCQGGQIGGNQLSEDCQTPEAEGPLTIVTPLNPAPEASSSAPNRSSLLRL